MQTIAVHIQVGKNQYIKPFCSFYYTHKYKNTLFSHETDLVFNQLDKSETFMSQLSLLFFSIFLLCHNVYDISANLIRVIEHLCDKATSAVPFNDSIGSWFRKKPVGV